jgi:Spy/CpxP family protein refolding chaperone
MRIHFEGGPVKTLRSSIVAAALVAAVTVWAQDDKAKKAAGRLPNNYGKLALSDEQKTRVYKIVGQYEDQILAIESELAMVKAKRDAACESVLTPGQRARLRELVAPPKKDEKP